MIKEFDIELGKILREKRKELGYSMEYVAQLMGITKMAVSNWETGKRSMYAESLADYCAILGTTMQEVFDLMERRKGNEGKTHQ